MLFWIGAIFTAVVGYYVYDVFRKHQYWKSKGIPSLFPYPIVNQIPDLIRTLYLNQSGAEGLLNRGRAQVLRFRPGFVMLFPRGDSFPRRLSGGVGPFDQKWMRILGRKFGYFDGPIPVIEVSDTDMLRTILVKDFSHFVDRRKHEPINGKIMEQAVTDIKGQRWKEVRSILVPTFTSGKMRQMNPLIADSCKDLVKSMEKIADDNEEFEAKELYGRITLDVIASAFFGTKIDAENPKNEFVEHAKNAFNFSLSSPLPVISFLFPKLVPLALWLGLEAIPRKTIDFFVRNTKEIIRLRTENPQNTRKDFIQLMLKSLDHGPEGSKGSALDGRDTTATQVKDVPGKDVEEDGVDIVSQSIAHSAETQLTTHLDYKLTAEELVAQAVIFFLAGYETTATTLSFLTYNLATHPGIQEKLRSEIERVMGDQEEPTYDLVAQMEYLDMCMNETLRMFPPIARTERLCTEDWHGHGIHLEKGTIVAIPIYAIQRDPEYWPEPDTFNPDRFSHENKRNIKPYTFETFGQGPRNCIGMRFAIFEIKMVMASVLRRFRIVPCARTEIPLQLKDVGFISAKNGVWCKLEKL